jgi:hypothetical protein
MKVSLSNTPDGIKVESLSKKAKHKTNRQAFFSRLMTKLSGDRGNTVSDLFVNQKTDDFKSEMYKIVDEIAADADGAKPEVE